MGACVCSPADPKCISAIFLCLEGPCSPCPEYTRIAGDNVMIVFTSPLQMQTIWRKVLKLLKTKNSWCSPEPPVKKHCSKWHWLRSERLCLYKESNVWSGWLSCNSPSFTLGSCSSCRDGTSSLLQLLSQCRSQEQMELKQPEVARSACNPNCKPQARHDRQLWEILRHKQGCEKLGEKIISSTDSAIRAWCCQTLNFLWDQGERHQWGQSNQRGGKTRLTRQHEELVGAKEEHCWVQRCRIVSHTHVETTEK